jgi:hypothetical protein
MPTLLQGKTFRFEQEFGRARSGEIGPPAGVYNFGAALNVTRLFLGYNAATRRVLNDFGVQNWYNYLSNFAQIELFRIGAALIDGSADEGRRRSLLQSDVPTEGEAQLKQGVQELSQATTNLADKIRERLGLSKGGDSKSLLQQLLRRNRGSSRGRTAAQVGKDARKVAAESDPFIRLKEAGVPLDGLGTQRYVESLKNGARAQGNPYLLQTEYVKGDAARGLPQPAGTMKAATATTEDKEAVAADMGILKPGDATTAEQEIAGDAEAVLGEAMDAAPVEDMLKEQEGVKIETVVVEEGNGDLLDAVQMGK